MKITIVSTGSSSTTKVCTFVEFAARGAWARIRYPGAAGLFSFSLVHGNMECWQNEHPLWRLSDQDLATLRVLAKDKWIKCSPPKGAKGLKSPRQRPEQSLTQLEIFRK